MGLYDRVIVECPLPDAGASAVREWQTKDFPDPYMENYKITADGRLMSERIHYENQSDKTAPRGSAASIMGCMTPVHEAWEDLCYHGVLNFYGDAHTGELMAISLAPETFGVDLNHPEAAEWFEYNAKFTDGKLVAIERVQAEPLPRVSGEGEA
jgi:hypothetical protein